MTADIVEGTAVEEHGTEIVAAPAAPPSLFGTDDPVEVVERATGVANALAAVIQQKKLYTNVQGKSHVHVEGWTLLGSMLGVTAVCTHTEQVDGGFKATVEARAADGRVVGRADALCTKHERRGPWKNADDYARLSMAQTRATSKALKGPLGFVISLAGYATTPAEEMTFAEPDPPQQQAKVGIPLERAEAMVNTAADLGRLDKLPLAVGAVAGRDLIGEAPPDRVAELLSNGLTDEQAGKLEARLAEVAAEQSA